MLRPLPNQELETNFSPVEARRAQSNKNLDRDNTESTNSFFNTKALSHQGRQETRKPDPFPLLLSPYSFLPFSAISTGAKRLSEHWTLDQRPWTFFLLSPFAYSRGAIHRALIHRTRLVKYGLRPYIPLLDWAKGALLG